VEIETATAEVYDSAVVSYVQLLFVEMTGESVLTDALAFWSATLSFEAPVFMVETSKMDIERILKADEAYREVIEATAMDFVADLATKAATLESMLLKWTFILLQWILSIL
jgi:hypothetical protein